ncbi:TIGR03016 family PEP-CTERM system-associated outer membrane protein [Roseateles sp. DC23W]|uniref:TIGR03016 family PEP-CTERM system-associated outer membrane protein n=1 Tax=Pelomonas dachongensis TaxID=3299029 RepID=A0ABW7ESV5_9BURK
MTRSRAERTGLTLLLAMGAAASQAQQATTSAGLMVTPRLSVAQTWTDNLLLDDLNKDAALITTVSPGISVVSNRGVLRGSLDYALNGITYLKSEQGSRVQNSLTANGQAELIGGVLFVDLRALIGQQNASAFGQLTAPTLGSQSGQNNLANVNQRETGMLSVAPTLRGMLGTLASYELRSELNRTEVRDSSVGDSRGHTTSLRVNQWNAGVLSWWLQASAQRVKSVTAPSNGTRMLKVGLTYRPDVDWLFTGNVGQERNDYVGATQRDGSTGGVTAQWTPTPRTRVGADWQRHGYGSSHALTFDHRLARSVWRLSDTQTTTLGNVGLQGGLRTNYDQFFLLFASLEPDPVKRDVLVRAYLQSQGLSPDAPIGGGFLSTGPSRMRNQQLMVTMQGVRSSVSVQATRTLTRRLGDNLNQGDLANSSRIEQRSYSLTLSHQLTPGSGLSLVASRQESQGDLASQAVNLDSVLGNWNIRFAGGSSLQLGARHSRSEGVVPYTENAVYANLTQQF